MRKNAIISAAASTEGEILAGLWGGEVEISCIGAPPQAPADVAPNSRAAVGAGTDGGSHAKLDNPDGADDKLKPGPNGDKIDGKDGKAPLPKLVVSAYNGGPMRLGGFRFPVIIDTKGVKFAAAAIPHYAGGHPREDASPAELMDCMAGVGACMVAEGKIKSTGEVTGDTPTVKSMLRHASKGVKFQASVHGRPTELEFIRDGESVNVNGRAVVGPVLVARQSVLDHVAILPLGADTTTSAHIAASHAAGVKVMEWTAWLKATYGMDQAGFDALPDPAKATMKAAFDDGGTPAKKVEKEPEITATADTTADTIKAQNDAISANLNRVSGIQAIDGAVGFPKIVAQAVSENWSVEKAENAIIKAQRDALTTSAFGHVNIGTGAGRAKAYTPRVIEAATLMSCGYDGNRLAQDRRYGQEVANLTDDFFRAERTTIITPSKLARICARLAGVNLPDGHGDDFWKEALADSRICPRGGERISAGYPTMSAEFTTLTLPAALSNVMNKFLLDSYLSVDPNDCDPAGGQAWKQFARITSVQDFKPHYRIRLVASLLLQRLGRGGEIQMGSVGEQSYMLTADTKAIMLGLTRKDLINDDMSVLSTLPTHFGIGAAESVANDIYDCLAAGLQSDGSTAFFTSSAITTAGNLMGLNSTASGAALSFTTLEAARARFATQTKPNGQPAGILGRVLLVPPGLTGVAKQLCESDMLIANYVSGNSTGSQRGTPANNTLKGLQKPVSSAYLANGTIKPDGTARAGSTTQWYLLAPSTAPAYPIEIGFLNGTEVPVIERAEADFDRLGIGFRTFLDYGVALSEPRSTQRQVS